MRDWLALCRAPLLPHNSEQQGCSPLTPCSNQVCHSCYALLQLLLLLLLLLLLRCVSLNCFMELSWTGCSVCWVHCVYAGYTVRCVCWVHCPLCMLGTLSGAYAGYTVRCVCWVHCPVCMLGTLPGVYAGNTARS